MSEPGDMQAPGWLQRNWTPKEPFDPTPWLQERFKNQIIKAKLPLELQQMALHNKASELAIEQQGIQNDQINKELDLYQGDLPALRAWQEKLVTEPGAMPPAFKSKQAMGVVASSQAAAAHTNLGFARQGMLTQQTKDAAEIARELNVALTPGPDGFYDAAEISNLMSQVQEVKHQREMEKKTVPVEWHAKLAEINGQLAAERLNKTLASQERRAGDRLALNYDQLDVREDAVVGQEQDRAENRRLKKELAELNAKQRADLQDKTIAGQDRRADQANKLGRDKLSSLDASRKDRIDLGYAGLDAKERDNEARDVDRDAALDVTKDKADTAFETALGKDPEIKQWTTEREKLEEDVIALENKPPSVFFGMSKRGIADAMAVKKAHIKEVEDKIEAKRKKMRLDRRSKAGKSQPKLRWDPASNGVVNQ